MDAESCNYILLWCPFVHKLWCMVYGLLGINWLMAGSVKDEHRVWAEICNNKIYLELVPLFGMRGILELLRGRRGRMSILEMDKYFWFFCFGS